MCAAYMRANKLKSANFPLYVRDIRVAMSAPMLDLEQKVEKAPGEKVVSCSSVILESVKDPERVTSVRIGRFIKDSEMDDWCYGVAMESLSLIHIFPGGWEFPSPALTVYIDRSGNNSHSEVCPRCGCLLYTSKHTAV